MRDGFSVLQRQVAMNSTGSPCLQSLTQLGFAEIQARNVSGTEIDGFCSILSVRMIIHSMKVFAHSYYAALPTTVQWCKN